MKIINNTLVSVIIIAYQNEKFILELLESIKRQTWDNIELIISDDGSTDSTINICHDWLIKNKKDFHNTTIITVPHNTGIPANCERGLRAAQGEWIKCIAGDDVLFENCIAENMKIVCESPDVSFIISDLIEIDDDSNIIRINNENEGLKYFFKNQKNKAQQLKAYARWPAFLNAPTFFYRKKIMEHTSFIDSLELRIFEDTVSIFKIINNGVKFYYLNKPTVKYRIHANGISRDISKTEKRELEAYKIYKNYRLRYLSPFNIVDWSVRYECWLRFKYKNIKGGKSGVGLLRKFSLFYWHLKLKGIKI